MIPNSVAVVNDSFVSKNVNGHRYTLTDFGRMNKQQHEIKFVLCPVPCIPYGRFVAVSV